MSQKLIAGWSWSQERIVGNNMLCERKGCGYRKGHAELGQHFSGKNILVLAPGDQPNSAQCRHRNEVGNRGQIVGGIKTTQDP